MEEKETEAKTPQPSAEPTAAPFPIDSYKRAVQVITENADNPDFHAAFQEHLRNINPDEDDHVSSTEITNALKSTIVDLLSKYHAGSTRSLIEG